MRTGISPAAGEVRYCSLPTFPLPGGLSHSLIEPSVQTFISGGASNDVPILKA